jgi:hypothetical protein
MTADAIEFAVVLPTLLVAHCVADHWVQTGWQAQNKGRRDAVGRLACTGHVASYTLTTILMVAAVWLLFDLPISPFGFLLGQTVSAATHYLMDRRFPLEWLVQRWPFSRMGKHDFYRLGAPREIAACLPSRVVRDDAGTRHIVRSQTVLLRAGDDGCVTWDNPSLGTGAYALDQSWHWFWLFIAALVTSLV